MESISESPATSIFFKNVSLYNIEQIGGVSHEKIA